MARPVTRAPDSQLPDWLELGRSFLADGDLSKRRASGGVQALPRGVNVRTAQRYARLAEFLRDHFPEHYSGNRFVAAGSASVLQLMQIHRVSPALALEVADRCLSGELSSAALRAELRKAREARETPEWLGRESSRSRRSSFEQRTLAWLSSLSELGNLGQIVDVEQSKGREPMAADAIIHLRDPDRFIALECKAPRDSADASTSNQAAQYVSRVAGLNLRYDGTVLVLPDEARGVAEATQNLWRSWRGSAKDHPETFRILVLGPARQEWIDPSNPPGSDD